VNETARDWLRSGGCRRITRENCNERRSEADAGTGGREIHFALGRDGDEVGINRTVAQVHALLYLSSRPLPADEIFDDFVGGAIEREYEFAGNCRGGELRAWCTCWETEEITSRRRKMFGKYFAS